MVSAIIAAAGSGRRMGKNMNKIFLPLGGQPVLLHSIKLFAAMEEVGEIIVAISPDESEQVRQLLAASGAAKPVKLAAGGRERQHSIANALQMVSPAAEIILVHDGARPLLAVSTAREVIAAARSCRAAGAAVPVKDTVKRVDSEEFVVDTPERSTLWAMQTPQAFAAELLREAYRQANEDGYLGTDDASLVERLGVRVKLVRGGYRNLKITTPEDLIMAEALLQNGGGKETMRVGIGYDVHRLVAGRKLVLGGVEVPHTLGLDGHSDADVLLHAIKDALLGAAALGDIGRHFPDSDARYKGISSLLLLAEVGRLLADKGYRVSNIDATIVAEKPRLAPFIAAMNANIARALAINPDQVNVKATTTEGLGFAGMQQGIAAYATVSLITA
ncbi:MAG: 2-C-methyl-D-erythritol 4-phosphate cytidylyltransferase [Negativicutes bacterium]|nr:2-C-methyl-D-erythritol 4-phosphate cytidylyltransferase [Negativicutes bacterium]